MLMLIRMLISFDNSLLVGIEQAVALLARSSEERTCLRHAYTGRASATLMFALTVTSALHRSQLLFDKRNVVGDMRRDAFEESLQRHWAVGRVHSLSLKVVGVTGS